MNLYLVRWKDGTITVISSAQENLYEVLKEECSTPELNADIRRLPNDFKSLETYPIVGHIGVKVTTWTFRTESNGYFVRPDDLTQVIFAEAGRIQSPEKEVSGQEYSGMHDLGCSLPLIGGML